MKKRIGILGGTFNPPHLGHLVLAQESLRKLNLEEVIFMPTHLSPHKKIKGNNAYMRCKMALLACRGNARFKVSRIEIKKRGVSYSVETLRRLRKKYGKSAELFFIIGSDSLNELESWKDVNEVLRLANFAAANRPGFPVKKLRKGIKPIEMPTLDISSSMIRERVRRSQPIRYLVPEEVRRFIVRHRLYK